MYIIEKPSASLLRIQVSATSSAKSPP